MSVKMKSFRYSPEEHPRVDQWIRSLEKADISFSSAIRRLIEDSEIEKGEIQKRIEGLERQIDALKRNQGRPADPMGPEIKKPIEPEPVLEEKAEEIKVDTSFIKNRYFS